ncbi:MAG: O-antigen ligase family protein [Hyphomicrobiaceae bacterium]
MEVASTVFPILYRIGIAFAITVGSFFVFAGAFITGRPMLMAAAGLMPLAGIVAWNQPFLVSSLFVTFSYFRLQEAYPFVSSLKPALVLGAASIGLVALKALLSTDREVADSRLLRVFCLLSLIGVVALAYPHAVLRAGGGSGTDVVAIPAVMLGASFCALVWTKLLSSTAEAPLPINLWLFTAYFVWLSITTIVSLVPSDSYSMWMNNPWKIAAMTLAISWLARSSRDFLLSSSIFILGGALVAAVVIYNKIYSLSLVNGTRVTIGRITIEEGVQLDSATQYALEQGKILNDPNDLALILLFPLAFALARVVCRRGLMDAVLSAGMSGIILLSIVFTQSRGALLGVVAVIGVLFLQRFKMALPALLAVMVAAPLIFSAMNFSSRDHSGVSQALQGELEDSAAHRIEAWKTAINMVMDRPITGIGPGNFNEFYRTYTNYWRSREMSAHSMWFQVLAELGIVGLGLFVAMIATSFMVNARSLSILQSTNAPASLRATGIALQSALAGTCVSGTFLSQAHTWPVYVIVGLIAALYNLAQNRSTLSK